MDVVDRAQQDMDFYASHRVEEHRPEHRATGGCLYCGEPVPPGERWCDKECRDEWEKEEKVRERQRRQR